jgi:hypothetical protein
VQHDWKYIKYKQLLGKGQAKSNTNTESNICQSKNVSLQDWIGLAIKFTWTIFPPLQIYMMTCIQEFSTAVEMPHRITKKYRGLQ